MGQQRGYVPHEWQAYRTKRSQAFSQRQPRTRRMERFRVVVKVIDILGYDTTKTVEVEVG